MNNTCGDRDCFVCYPEDPSILAENKRLREALEKIVDEMSHKDPTYNEILSVAQEALKKISA